MALVFPINAAANVINDTDECDLWGVLDDLRSSDGDGSLIDAAGTDALSDGACSEASISIGACAGTADKNAYGRKKRGGIGYCARSKLDTDESACENCGSKHLQVDEGQYVCCDCNYIQARVIDNGAEWRFYGAEDSRDNDPTRCGMPTNNLLPKSSLGSMVGGRWNDNRDNRRLRQYQMWNSMPYWERTLYSVFEKLSSNASTHGIFGKILDDAKILYKTASEKKISRGDKREGLIASCMFFACAINKCQRSTKEIARMFNIDPTVLTEGNSRFQDLMQITVESSGPEDFIGRFGSRLNMDYNDVIKCKVMTQRIDEIEIVSRNAPTSVAAGALYFYIHIHKLDFTKKQVADVCEVSEVTITKCFKQLMQYKEVILEEIAQAVPQPEENM